MKDLTISHDLLNLIAQKDRVISICYNKKPLSFIHVIRSKCYNWSENKDDIL